MYIFANYYEIIVRILSVVCPLSLETNSLTSTVTSWILAVSFYEISAQAKTWNLFSSAFSTSKPVLWMYMDREKLKYKKDPKTFWMMENYTVDSHGWIERRNNRSPRDPVWGHISLRINAVVNIKRFSESSTQLTKGLWQKTGRMY